MMTGRGNAAITRSREGDRIGCSHSNALGAFINCLVRVESMFYSTPPVFLFAPTYGKPRNQPDMITDQTEDYKSGLAAGVEPCAAIRFRHPAFSHDPCSVLK